MTKSPHYIYIAHNPQANPSFFKIGYTRQHPQTRCSQLRGAVLTDFELVRVFETSDGPRAEKLVHTLLDNIGARSGLNARREHFCVTLESAVALCEQAVAYVAKAERSTASPTPPQVAANKPSLTHHRRHWKSLLSMPVRYANQSKTLGELMAKAVYESKAAIRLKSMGVECSYFNKLKPEFLFRWDEAQTLKDWCQVNALEIPGRFGESREVFNFA